MTVFSDEINEVAEKLVAAMVDLGRDWSAEITQYAGDDGSEAIVEVSEMLARGRNRKLAEIHLTDSDDRVVAAELYIQGAKATVLSTIRACGIEVQ